MRDVAEQNSDQAADGNEHSPIEGSKVQQAANRRTSRGGVSEGRQSEQETREHTDDWRVDLLGGPNDHVAGEVAHGDNNNPKGDNHEARVDLEDRSSGGVNVKLGARTSKQKLVVAHIIII